MELRGPGVIVNWLPPLKSHAESSSDKPAAADQAAVLSEQEEKQGWSAARRNPKLGFKSIWYLRETEAREAALAHVDFLVLSSQAP